MNRALGQVLNLSLACTIISDELETILDLVPVGVMIALK